MKSNQRVYESNEPINLYLKFNHSINHLKNLDNIKNRKNKFIKNNILTTREKSISHKKKTSCFDISNI
jgi:hypothetical protein